MPATLEKQAVTSKELEALIEKAKTVIGSQSENDICRYLPMKTGGYMHHFTMRKMKRELPSELGKLIETHILDSEDPTAIPGKRRAPRGSRKRRDHVSFNRAELEHMLRIARLAGDKELIRKLTPKRDLKNIKRSLINSIRQERVESDLWHSYCEVVTTPVEETTSVDSTI